jgi:hypothetical protein
VNVFNLKAGFFTPPVNLGRYGLLQVFQSLRVQIVNERLQPFAQSHAFTSCWIFTHDTLYAGR